MTLLDKFEAFYRDFKVADLDQLYVLYEEDLAFRDPVHQVNSIAELRRYFAASREHVAECRFEFIDRLADVGNATEVGSRPADIGERRCAYRWCMHYRHPRLANGQLLHLQGMTYLRMREKILHHEDIFDMGAMLYEHVPVLGVGLRWLKRRLGEA